MKLLVAADHGGFALKERLLRRLQAAGYSLIDSSPRRTPRDDYPSVVVRALRLQQRFRADRCIFVCRSGVGVAIAANKHRGVRAVQGSAVAVVTRSRREEDTNVLTLGADVTPTAAAWRVTRAWLQTPFQPLPRYRRRLRQLARLDHDA